MLAICIIHQTHTHTHILIYTRTQQWYLRVTRGVGSEGGRRGVRGLPTASATLAIYFMNANPCVHSGLLCFTHTHTHTQRTSAVCVFACVWEFQVFHIHFHSYRSFHSCTAKTESETELNWIFIIIMSVTRFSPLPSPPPLFRPCPKVAFVYPWKKCETGRGWGSEAKEKRILLAQFFLSSLSLSLFSVFYLFLLCDAA